MFPFTMTIDDHDHLYFAGVGSRVTVWNTNGDFLWEFCRKHPDGFVRSIRVGRDGRIYIGALDILSHTVIDVYDAKGQYLSSFGHSYVTEKDADWRTESFVGGGSLDLLGDGRIAYSQQVPYRITLFSPAGESLISTDAGGKDFLLLSPEPDYTKKTFKMGLSGSSVQLICLGDRLLNCAIRTTKVKNCEKTQETLLTLYDDTLNLVARSVLEGYQIVEGSTRSTGCSSSRMTVMCPWRAECG